MQDGSITDWISVAIAGIALVLSIVATVNTFVTNRRQAKVNKTQEEINRRLLEKDDTEKEDSKKAELDANFEKIGKNYKLKIFNKGQSTARNVNLEQTDGDGIFIASEVKEKFPLDVLEPHSGISLNVIAFSGMKTKHQIVITWDDDSGNDREVTLTRHVY